MQGKCHCNLQKNDTDIQNKDHLEFQEETQSQICAKRNRAQEAKALIPPNHVCE